LSDYRVADFAGKAPLTLGARAVAVCSADIFDKKAKSPGDKLMARYDLRDQVVTRTGQVLTIVLDLPRDEDGCRYRCRTDDGLAVDVKESDIAGFSTKPLKANEMLQDKLDPILKSLFTVVRAGKESLDYKQAKDRIKAEEATYRRYIATLKQAQNAAEPKVVALIGTYEKKLDALLLNAPEPSREIGAIQPFFNIGQPHAFPYPKDRFLIRLPDDTYLIADADTFEFSKLNACEMPFVIRYNTSRVLVGGQSHWPMTQGGAVTYAGHVRFDEDSRLIFWNNDTGHYTTNRGFAHQGASVTNDLDFMNKYNLSIGQSKDPVLPILAQSVLPIEKFRKMF
jgi:hypothetical protein